MHIDIEKTVHGILRKSLFQNLKTGKRRSKKAANARSFGSQENSKQSWEKPHTTNATEVVLTGKQGQGNVE